MSKDTIAPITYVPYVVLYVNGRPFMKYSGPPLASEIKRFVIDVAQKIETKQKFSNENVKEDPRGRIPAYTIGIPKCDEEECYFAFNDAYTKLN